MEIFATMTAIVLGSGGEIPEVGPVYNPSVLKGGSVRILSLFPFLYNRPVCTVLLFFISTTYLFFQLQLHPILQKLTLSHHPPLPLTCSRSPRALLRLAP